MELRVLQYFLAVAREQSILHAAESLHLSQPTLSRQLKELEEELGKQLFVRSNRKITLTEEGMILRKRAAEILELVKKAEDEIALSSEVIAGDITLGAGETEGVRVLARAAHALQREHPLVHFHIHSGDSATVTEELDRGLIDFGLLLGDVDTSKYEALELPHRDTWGVLMRRDAPLAQKETIAPEDLWEQPVIVSRQLYKGLGMERILGRDRETLNIVATYNLMFNGSLMVEEGMGYAVGLDKIIHVSPVSNLCFRPFSPRIEAGMCLVWKKYQVFTKAAEQFLMKVRTCPCTTPRWETNGVVG